MPWFIVQKILSLLNYDDLCNVKKVCRTNEILNEYFEMSNIRNQFACPICIMQKPFEKIGFNNTQCCAEKLREYIDVYDGDFFVQLKNLTIGNGNWSALKDNDGWYLSRKYNYLVEDIHVNPN